MTVRMKIPAAARIMTGFFFKTVVLFLFCVMIIFMRIDKLLCEMNIGSRSEVKSFLKKGQILVNNVAVNKPDTKVDEKTAVITFKGKEYRYAPFAYYMMNKPAGIVSATTDDKDRTVLDLLKENLLQNRGELTGIPLSDIFPVGRLDKDTVGLLLLTNDGELAHRLLSPKKHVPKTYYVETDGVLTQEAAKCLEQGVDIGEKELTKEAEVEILSEKSCTITITEGKFHQVKRMFQAVDLKVMYLKRLSMGTLKLDEQLAEGEVRKLTQEEVEKLC